jgi:hypothetical protein
MDEQPKNEEVEDLDVPEEEGDEVKGGTKYITKIAPASFADEASRGGWDGNHNESLIRA